MLAGVDLLTAKVGAYVEIRHRSWEFIGFLKHLGAANPTHPAIKLILDNHPGRVSKGTEAWLSHPTGSPIRLSVHPKHASWRNLLEGFFPKTARSMLRQIRVVPKDEFEAAILAYLDDLNLEAAIHTWTYSIDAAI